MKNRSLLGETGGSAAGPVGTNDGALISLPLNDKRRLGYLATSSPKYGIMSVPNKIGHECTTFGSAKEEPMDSKGGLSLEGFDTYGAQATMLGAQWTQ